MHAGAANTKMIRCSFIRAQWLRTFRGCLPGLVSELLPADRGFVHQARLVHREDGNAIGITGVGARARLERDGGGLRVESEVAVLEAVQGSLGLEKDDFRVTLPAKLSADGGLAQIAIADDRVILIEIALAVSATDANRAFPDGGEDRVAGGMVEELVQTWVVLAGVGN